MKMHLFVDVLCSREISRSSLLSLDQVITVNSGGNGSSGETRRDELEHSHLSRGVLKGLVEISIYVANYQEYLHGHSIGSQTEVGDSSVDVLLGRLIQMTVQDLLRESERTLQSTS